MIRRALSTTPAISHCGFDVTGRNFLITGGSQGLGLEISRKLKENGASGIVIAARSEGKGVEAAKDLDGDGCRVRFVQADTADPESVKSLASEAASLMKGPIHGLVNAAASTARGNLLTTTVDDWDMMLDINTRGPFLLTQEISKHMIENKVRGSIVNITSNTADGGAPFIMAYSVSKAALVCLTKNNAAELARRGTGIRVNCVNMGWCYTENEDKLQQSQNGGDPTWIDRADAGIPLGRILRPGDVAATVGFLLSDSSAMMSGTCIELHPEYPKGMMSLALTDSDDGR